MCYTYDRIFPSGSLSAFSGGRRTGIFLKTLHCIGRSAKAEGDTMKYIGTSRPVHDARGKAAGYVKYAGDISLPGMAYIALVHSSIPHGYVKAVHTEKALAVQGVYGVFHAFNTDTKPYNRYRSNFDQASLAQEENVFCRYVRYVGDRIAAVAAVDQETAERAARLVEVEYEALPFTTGFDDTLAGGNCLAGETPVKDEFLTEVGDAPTEEGLVEVVTESEIPRIHHLTLETHACVADYDPFSRKLTLYSPNQAVHGIRTVISDLLDMPMSSVRVMKATMGGSFGAKQEWFVEPVAAVVAQKLGRPVKLCYTRAEAMTCAIVRGAMRCRTRALYTPQGLLKSLSLELLMDAGAYLGSSGDYVRALSSKLFRAYRIGHVRYHARVISSNTPVSGAFRSWSAAEAAIMLERNIDEAAAVLGLDRTELRLLNAHRPGDLDAKSHLPLEDIRFADAIVSGREQFRWVEKQKEDALFNASQPRYRRGVGIGAGGHGNTYYPRFNDYGQCRLQLNADGTIQLSATLHDHGCGTVSAIRMIVAEVLDMSDADICAPEGDTEHTPTDFGCYASRTTYVLGRAACQAAEALRTLMLDRAAVLYRVDRSDLYTETGHIRSRSDASFSVSYGTLARDAMHADGRNLSADEQFTNSTNPGVTGVHFAHVEVDTWTGFTKILDYLAVQDIGQPINAGMCTAQIQGAVQMGCGAALREKLTIGKDGRCTESLAKYHAFLANDLPNIEVSLLTDGRSSQGPFGAKSIGEICYVPVAPAVCSAVNDALDSSLGVLPFDPDCILKHLAKERENHEA